MIQLSRLLRMVVSVLSRLTATLPPFVRLVLGNTALFALWSALLMEFVSQGMVRQQAEYELKHDVLQRIVGHRYILTNVPECYEGEPFIALNEAYVVYADDEEVIAALKKMHKEIYPPEGNMENLLSVVKAMTKAADVPATLLDDEFFLKPFVPGS